jgi:hypothetical protein
LKRCATQNHAGKAESYWAAPGGQPRAAVPTWLFPLASRSEILEEPAVIHILGFEKFVARAIFLEREEVELIEGVVDTPRHSRYYADNRPDKGVTAVVGGKVQRADLLV